MNSPVDNEAVEVLKPCPFCNSGDHLRVVRIGSMVSNGFVPMAVCCSHLDCDDVQGPTANGKYAAIAAWNRRSPPVGVAEPVASFQARVKPWMLECFNEAIAADVVERCDRFIEEALELIQANGCPADRAHALVEYVYGRPQGDINQEVGGVMVTLAALCLATGVDMHDAGETELARVWTKIDKIRAKQASKPAGSALPVALATPPEPVAEIDRVRAGLRRAIVALAAAISLLEKLPRTSAAAASDKMFSQMIGDYRADLAAARAALQSPEATE